MDILSLIQTILFALLAIGILVTVHEYGHYIVARKLGIKVLRFSVGFGKPIWRKRAGVDNTEYVVSRWPLGGYVKMLDSRDGDVAPQDRHRAFNHQPVFNRILVLLAGPVFNFILAIVFFWAVFVLGVAGMKPIVGEVRSDSRAAEAGLESDDLIVSVNGDDVLSWSDAHMAMLDAVINAPTIDLVVRNKDSQRTRRVTISELGDRKALTEPEALLTGLGVTPWAPTTVPLVGEVLSGSPASAAGFEIDDQLIRVADEPTPTRTDAMQRLRAYPDQQIEVVVLRDNQEQRLPVLLSSVSANGERIGRLGVTFKPSDAARAEWDDARVIRKMSLIPALGRAVSETGSMSVMMVSMLGKMLVGQVSVKNISGPLNIARFAGYTAKQGPTYYLRFLALLSLSLGVLNLLPIPMLDGGQVVYQVAEAIKGSPVSMRAELIGQQIGIALLLILMFFAFRNDLVSIFG
ncbi:MAG: RIP metalloprotease RseP [Pseudomonadota bacterium]